MIYNEIPFKEADEMWNNVFTKLGILHNENPLIVRKKFKSVNLNSNIGFNVEFQNNFITYLIKLARQNSSIFALDYFHESYNILMDKGKNELLIWPGDTGDYYCYYINDDNFIFYHPWNEIVYFYGTDIINNMDILFK